MTISPCISICKTDPVSGYCYGCGRNNEEKIKWKNENTTDEWKVENLKVMDGDYDVEISSKNISHLSSKSKDVEYWVALEPESSYE